MLRPFLYAKSGRAASKKMYRILFRPNTTIVYAVIAPRLQKQSRYRYSRTAETRKSAIQL